MRTLPVVLVLIALALPVCRGAIHVQSTYADPADCDISNCAYFSPNYRCRTLDCAFKNAARLSGSQKLIEVTRSGDSFYEPQIYFPNDVTLRASATLAVEVTIRPQSAGQRAFTMETGGIGGIIEGNGKLKFADYSATNGAIVTLGAGSHFNADEVTFAGNVATGGVGGVVYAHTGSAADLVKCTFDDNSASTDGGALWLRQGTFLLSQNVFIQNTATGNGGAVYMDSITLSGSGNDFQFNTAGDNGGALYITGISNFATSSITVKFNTASTGGGVYFATAVDFSTQYFTIQSNEGDGWFFPAGSVVIMNTGSTTENSGYGARCGGDVSFDGGYNTCDLTNALGAYGPGCRSSMCDNCHSGATCTPSRTYSYNYNGASAVTVQCDCDGDFYGDGMVDGTGCTACTTCTGGKYETVACSGGTNRICQDCRTCGSNEYETGACTPTTDRECTACTCPGGQYRSSGCSGTTPPTCTSCRTCSAGEYESSPCSYSANRGCTPCPTCPTGQKNTGCSGTNPGSCVLTQCTSPPGVPSNGGVSFSDGNRHGSVATFTCDTGYTGSSSYTRTCNAPSSDQPWPSASFSCVRTRCTTNSPSAHAQGSVSYSDTDYHNSVATFSCNTGYSKGGTPSITCNAPSANAAWPAASPTCTATSCTSPPVSASNGQVSFSNGNLHNSVATFTCDVGYKSTGTSSVTCSAPSSNAVWPGASPQCARTVCSSPPSAHPSGTVSFTDGNYHGSLATFSCNTGYKRSGTTSTSCNAPLADSSWGAASPACTATQCTGPPSAPPNGEMDISNGNNHNSVASFSCNDGFVLSGASSLTCSAVSDDQPWPSNVPTCIDTGCTVPPTAHPDGTVSFSDGSAHGSVATFSCNAGYSRSGTTSVTCNAPSSSQPWPVANPQCSPTSCTSPPAAPTSGSVVFSNGNRHGSVATFSCPEGFYVAGTATLTCAAPSSNTAWPTSTATCQRTTCNNPPPTPTYGTISYSDGQYHDSVASFSCNSGYTLTSSPSSIVCSAISSDRPWPTIATPTCGDENGCGGNTCANLDVGAVCNDRPAPALGYTCSCSTGYSDQGGMCRNWDACGSHTCDAEDSAATCVDDAPPSVGYTCRCSPGYHFEVDTCVECLAGTFKDTVGVGPCTPCHADASSPAGASASSACQCDFGFFGDGVDDCSPCTGQDNCISNAASCVPSTGDLVCNVAADGYYVDGQGVVVACPAGCTRCDGPTNCMACADENAAPVDGVCTCNEDYVDTSEGCSLFDACDGNICASGEDTGAGCTRLSATEAECACSPGFSENAGVCVDTNGCASHECTANGDAEARCADVPAADSSPGAHYTCTCSAGFTSGTGIDGPTCQACPPGCSSCPGLQCSACFSPNAQPSSDGSSCECDTGFYPETSASGFDCLACALAITGCGTCSSATLCDSCNLGTLSPDGTACSAGAGETRVVGGDATAEDGDGSTAGIVGGLVAGMAVLAICAGVLLFIALRRKSPKNTKKYTTEGGDSTVQLDNGSFGAYLQSQIDKVKPFASGGFGAVYRVKLENGTDVALKVLDPDADISAKAEFHRESTILTKLTVLNSPLIVSMVCFCEDPVCLGMEYAEKGTLLDRLKKGPMEGDELTAVITDSAKPLAFLHKKGFAHLDVKPQNYLVMADDRVVICDFGLSIEVSEPMSTTSGTPQYLAPERYFAAGRAGSVTSEVSSDYVTISDPRACDVFSWGIMATAFANGEVPFSKMPSSNVPSMLAERNMRPSFPEDTPVWIVELASSCWEHYPEKRPTMDAALTKIRNFCDNDSTVFITNPNDATVVFSTMPSCASEPELQSATLNTAFDSMAGENDRAPPPPLPSKPRPSAASMQSRKSTASTGPPTPPAKPRPTTMNSSSGAPTPPPKPRTSTMSSTGPTPPPKPRAASVAKKPAPPPKPSKPSS